MIRWMFSILGDERKRYYKLESLAELISTYFHSKVTADSIPIFPRKIN